jgi:hypothetical protein
MNGPQSNYGSQQPYPSQQHGYPGQVYGPYRPPKKSKMPMMIGIIVAAVTIIVVLVILFLVVLKPEPQAMTATQIVDDYEFADWNYRSFNEGDTITLTDTITDIDQSWSSTWLSFEYTGTNPKYQWNDFSVKVTGDNGACKVDDVITLTATVESPFDVELQPESLDWSVADTSSCSA